MSRLARLTEASEGTEVFVNPDHVQSIQQVGDETMVIFGDGRKLCVKEAARVAVAALDHAGSG
jgi:uncharacterized protein YlzI (FlbEa/FlbD family)